MPLFVVLQNGFSLTDELIERIKQRLKAQFSPGTYPMPFTEISEVPYTISGKKLESPVKKILAGMDASLATSKDTLRNPPRWLSSVILNHNLRSQKARFCTKPGLLRVKKLDY